MEPFKGTLHPKPKTRPTPIEVGSFGSSITYVCAMEAQSSPNAHPKPLIYVGFRVYLGFRRVLDLYQTQIAIQYKCLLELKPSTT